MLGKRTDEANGSFFASIACTEKDDLSVLHFYSFCIFVFVSGKGREREGAKRASIFFVFFAIDSDGIFFHLLSASFLFPKNRFFVC